MPRAHEIVASHLAGTAGVEPAVIHSDSTFAELMIDSLALTELAQVVEDETGVDIAPGIGVHSTVGDAAARLERGLAGRAAKTVRPAGMTQPG